MLSKQATITLTASSDPTGSGVTLDDLLEFVSAVQSLEAVQTIELYEGEIIAVGTEASLVRPKVNIMPAPRTLVRP